jgi:hypothetical protein
MKLEIIYIDPPPPPTTLDDFLFTLSAFYCRSGITELSPQEGLLLDREGRVIANWELTV